MSDILGRCCNAGGVQLRIRVSTARVCEMPFPLDHPFPPDHPFLLDKLARLVRGGQA